MKSKTASLNDTLAKTLTFIQQKVNDGILNSSETAETIKNLQQHVKYPSFKKNSLKKGSRGRSCACPGLSSQIVKGRRTICRRRTQPDEY